MPDLLTNDLSKTHRLISNLFPGCDSKDCWDKYSLSDYQLEFYQKNGYLSNIQILDQFQIEEMRMGLEKIYEQGLLENPMFYEFHANESTEKDKVLFHCLGHWRISEVFHDVLWNPGLVIPAYQLFGEKTVRFWHDQLFVKPPLHGGPVAWHQDYSYWTRTGPMQHITCWIGLDDSNEENGCLQYIPGSHKWDLLEKADLAGEIENIRNHLNYEQLDALDSKVAIEMPAGYGSFHHPLMVHGSYPNISDSPRRAFVINMISDGVKSLINGELLNGVPEFKVNQKLAGQFFPVLFKQH